MRLASCVFTIVFSFYPLHSRALREDTEKNRHYTWLSHVSGTYVFRVQPYHALHIQQHAESPHPHYWTIQPPTR